MGIIDSFKEIYYYWEDKYYSFLDKVNESIPIYKVIDPIDRVFPTFVLFFLLIIFLLGFLAFTFVSPDFISNLFGGGTAGFSATIKVSADDVGVEGASVNVIIVGKQSVHITDSFGEAKVPLPSQSVQAELSVSKEGFNPQSASLLLEHNKLYDIRLSGIVSPAVCGNNICESGKGESFANCPADCIGGLEGTFNVFIIDSQSRRLITNSATIDFSCSSGAQAPSPITRVGGEFKDIQKPSDCGELLMDISADAYEPKTGVRLDRTPKYVELDPIGIEAVGNIKVTVVDTNNSPVSGVDIKIFNSAGVMKNQKQSTSSGNALFEGLDVDTYKITASLASRFSERQNIQVETGETTDITITLPNAPAVGKKVFLKMVDSNSNAPVADAKVNLFANGSFFESRNSDTTGIASIVVSDQNIDFVAVITHQNYIMKIVRVQPVDETSPTPTTISLSPFVPELAVAATVNVADNDTNGPVQNATVLLFNTDYNGIILNYPYTLTSVQGQAFFSRLPADGNYFATATSRNQYGLSASKKAVSGQTLVLDIFLVFTEGRLRITAKDSATKSLIQGATVAIHNFSDSTLIESGLTNSNGVFESSPIPTDKTAYIIVGATNYLRFISQPVPVARGVNRIEVLLVQNNFLPPVCGNATCEAGETTDTCPQDCGLPVCGDNVCSASESSSSCPADCGQGPVCGQNGCEFGETPLTCSEDCGNPPVQCNDGVCGAGENQQNCPQDCGFPPAPCGDNVCSDNEFPTTCPIDCGFPPLPAPNVFDIAFAGFYTNSEATTKASVLQSDAAQPKQYYAKWNLFLPIDRNYSTLLSFFRFGQESSAPIQLPGYKIKAKGNVRSTPFSSAYQGKCYTLQNDFNALFHIPDACIVDPGLDAKQVNVFWNNPFSNASLIVIVPVLVEQGLADGTDIDVRYQARGLFDGNYFQTQKFFKQFKIGVPICTPGVDCPAFLWKFFIEGQELPKVQISNFSLETKFSLSSKTVFDISSEVRNTSGQDFSGLDLNVENRNPAGAISFPLLGQGSGPHTILSGISIPEDTRKELPLLTIRSGEDTDFTELLYSFGITSSFEDKNKTLFFKVLPGKALLIQLSSDKLNPFDDQQRVQGIVKDANTLLPLRNAIAKLFVPGSTDPFGTAITDVNGFFSLPVNMLLSPNQTVVVEVSKSGYRTATASLSVLPLRFIDPRYNCVSIDQNSFNVAIGGSFGISVKTTNCPENVEVKLNTGFVSNPASVSLDQNDLKTITLTAQNAPGYPEIIPGIYPIFVQARFGGDVRFVNAFLAKVIVNDPNTCFSLSKYSFDLETRPSDSGIVNNSCPLAFPDPWLPELSLASRDAALKNLDSNIPSRITFDWRIEVKFITADKNDVRPLFVPDANSKNLGVIDSNRADANAVDANRNNLRPFKINNLVVKLNKVRERTFVIGPLQVIMIPAKHKGFVLGSFVYDARKYFDQNDSFILDVELTPKSSDNRVQTWIVGNRIYGKYAGSENRTSPQSAINFEIANVSLNSTQFTRLTVLDYVGVLK